MAFDPWTKREMDAWYRRVVAEMAREAWVEPPLERIGKVWGTGSPTDGFYPSRVRSGRERLGE